VLVKDPASLEQLLSKATGGNEGANDSPAV